MGKKEPFEMDPKELFKQFKEVYHEFNQVLKNGDAGERFSAVVKMDLLSKTLKEFVDVYNENHDIPIEMIIEAFGSNKDEASELKEFDANAKEVEQVLSETKKLMDKFSPIRTKRKGDRGRLKIRRFSKKKIKD